METASAVSRKALPRACKPGDCFLFGGRLLELVRIHDMTAWVRRASGKRPTVPRWNGRRDALVDHPGRRGGATARAGRGGALRQPPSCTPCGRCWTSSNAGRPCPRRRRCWPNCSTRARASTCFVSFAGRQVHLGLASLLAWRAARLAPRTFSIAVNDYGFELLSATEVDWPTVLPQVLKAGR